MPFLMTDTGMVNLDHVVELRDRPKGDYLLLDKDGEHLGVISSAQMERCIESVVAVHEPYDCLQIWFNGDEPYVTVSNVVAWGVSVYGFIHPFTDDEVSLKTENYGLRRRGQKPIEVADDATYPDEASWLAELVAGRQREKEREAAKK